MSQRTIIELSTGVSIEAVVSQPVTSSGANEVSSGSKLAVCLHPWSWLGGRMNDPVLISLVEPLRNANHHVVRYNSRGVGRSTGWSSFTGLSEVADLQALVQWAMAVIPDIRSVVLVGYSYGALIASAHPVLQLPIKTSHLLLSYPLGPRSWLTLFRSGTFEEKLLEIIGDENSNVLIIYGNKDEFTSVSNYRGWKAGLGEGRGRLRVVEIDEGTHFWRGDDWERGLAEVVGWLP